LSNYIDRSGAAINVSWMLGVITDAAQVSVSQRINCR
jgi:hypothetical protein